jgi:hypothetical protein
MEAAAFPVLRLRGEAWRNLADDLEALSGREGRRAVSGPLNTSDPVLAAEPGPRSCADVPVAVFVTPQSRANRQISNDPGSQVAGTLRVHYTPDAADAKRLRFLETAVGTSPVLCDVKKRTS